MKMFESDGVHPSTPELIQALVDIPLRNKDNGVRPIAVGDLLRRLSCKLALTLVKDDIHPALVPHQLGVGVPNGTEAIIHAVDTRLEQLADPQCILQIDFSNAFNLVSRNEILSTVASTFPKLGRITNYLYGNQGILRVGNSSETILSCLGVQQGCPLASLLFATVPQKLVNEIKTSVPQLLLNLWYLDDGHIAGDSRDVLRALDNYSRKGS